MCAGLIGWRSYRMAGEGVALGLYGFGAAAHILAQVAAWQGRRIYAFTRPGDAATQNFARSLGAVWAGGSEDMPPQPLDAAIIFAPVGALVPAALRAVKKGGRVVCGGIHMSDIPSFPYRILWEERQLVSVANLTRADAREFLGVAPQAGIKMQVTRYPLTEANRRWPTCGPAASKAPPCLFRELRSPFGDAGRRQRNEASETKPAKRSPGRGYPTLGNRPVRRQSGRMVVHA